MRFFLPKRISDGMKAHVFWCGLMATLRKMTMGEVAEVAGLPKETLRSRINRGVSEARKSPGWARFDLPEVMQIAVHAEIMRRVGVEQIAMQAAIFVAESIENFCKYPPHRLKRRGQLGASYLIFRRADHGDWMMSWLKDQDQALDMVGAYIFHTEELKLSGFYFMNASTVADWAMDRVFDLQEIDGDEGEVRS